MRAIRKLLALSALALCAGAIAAQPSEFKVTLLSEAVVHGDSIYLSDLLPSGAPAETRSLAQGILLGAAPQPGSARVFAHDVIASRIQGAGALRSLEIPGQIVVRRAGWLITREEVLAAIRTALENNGFSGATALQTEDIRLAAPVMVTATDVRLQVTRMDFDPALQEIRFLLAPRGEQGVLPFLATARFRGDIPLLVASHEIQPGPMLAPRDLQTVSRAAYGTPARPNQIGTIVLVEAGKSATLRLVSNSMQMLLEVTPLERGIHGQDIRVRLEGTGKVLHARVVGSSHLEATF